MFCMYFKTLLFFIGTGSICLYFPTYSPLLLLLRAFEFSPLIMFLLSEELLGIPCSAGLLMTNFLPFFLSV